MGYAVDVPKEERLCVRLSTEQKTEIEASAASEGLNASAFMLWLYAQYKKQSAGRGSPIEVSNTDEQP